MNTKLNGRQNLRVMREISKRYPVDELRTMSRADYNLVRETVANDLYPPSSPPCGCEHVSHFLPEDLTYSPALANCVEAGTGHAYMGISAGSRTAKYVGPVCDDCARTHMKRHLV